MNCTFKRSFSHEPVTRPKPNQTYLRSRNGLPRVDATALASMVFPVPGGPHSRRQVVLLLSHLPRPHLSCSSGCLLGRTATSSSARLTSRWPITSEKDTPYKLTQKGKKLLFFLTAERRSMNCVSCCCECVGGGSLLVPFSFAILYSGFINSLWCGIFNS